MENQNNIMPDNEGQYNSSKSQTEYAEVPQDSGVYSYTAATNNVIPTEPQYVPPITANEPTVQCNVASVPQTDKSNSGLKVFFSILAVTVAVIIAVSAGYIFGSKGGTPSFHTADSGFPYHPALRRI